jgi:hypothetical protein
MLVKQLQLNRPSRRAKLSMKDTWMYLIRPCRCFCVYPAIIFFPSPPRQMLSSSRIKQGVPLNLRDPSDPSKVPLLGSDVSDKLNSTQGNETRLQSARECLIPTTAISETLSDALHRSQHLPVYYWGSETACSSWESHPEGSSAVL